MAILDELLSRDTSPEPEPEASWSELLDLTPYLTSRTWDSFEVQLTELERELIKFPIHLVMSGSATFTMDPITA